MFPEGTAWIKEQKSSPLAGRWQPEPLTEGALVEALRSDEHPLHHAARGPPPRAGEDFHREKPFLLRARVLRQAHNEWNVVTPG
tara:strand:- start:3681 stop:3932 length:252 start_codon:yes stop_codon:yes gene_type:complete